MEQKKKKRMLDDELLDQVVGGATWFVSNSDANDVVFRSGPGSNYDEEYTLNNGQRVYTTGYKVYNEQDGYYWSEVDDGRWVPTHLLGKNYR